MLEGQRGTRAGQQDKKIADSQEGRDWKGGKLVLFKRAGGDGLESFGLPNSLLQCYNTVII